MARQGAGEDVAGWLVRQLLLLGLLMVLAPTLYVWRVQRRTGSPTLLAALGALLTLMVLVASTGWHWLGGLAVVMAIAGLVVARLEDNRAGHRGTGPSSRPAPTRFSRSW